MIKIIHFVPSINVTSGIAHMIMNYYRVMDHNNIQFDFIYFIKESESNFGNEIRLMGGNTVKVSSPTQYYRFYKEMCDYLGKQKNKDIIFHNHQIAFTILLKPIVSKYKINNFIVHNHMTKYSDKLKSSIRNRIMCFPISFMNVKYFACSKEAGRFLFGKKSMDNGLVTIMNNGIDCEKYKFVLRDRIEMRAKLGIEDNFVIGHVGHFDKVKNHEFIIDIFLRIAKSNPTAFLLLIGTGQLKKDIETKINNLNLSHQVLILENRKDIPKLMHAMDIFVFPSLFEGLGIAAIEAQANGLPVLMSDKVPKAVQIYNCSILKLEDGATKWANEIEKIYSKSNSREEANAYVQNSTFDIYKSEKEIQMVYEKMLN